MADRKKIVMTLDDELYERIQDRARRMGVTMAAFCLYQTANALTQMELAEKVAVQAIKEHADNLQHLAD
jgi:hypothetical protein